MKKLLALLTALILALSCTLALAEAPAPVNMTIEGTLTVDEDAVKNLMLSTGMDEEQWATYEPIVNLLINMGERIVIADNGLQYDLTLKGQDIASLVAEMTEDGGLRMGTTLLPSYILTASPETVKSLIQASMGGENALDMEALTKAANDLSAAAASYIQEYVTVIAGGLQVGEPESVDYEYGDYTFNTRIPANVDVATIAEGMNEITARMMADEAVKAAAENVIRLSGQKLPAGDEGEPVDFTKIAEQFASVEGSYYCNLDESGAPSGANMIAVNAVMADEAASEMNAYFVMDNGSFQCDFELPSANTFISLYFVGDPTGGYMGAAITANETYVGLTCGYEVGEVIALTADLYLNGTEKPLASAVCTIAQGGERTLSLDDGDKTVVDIDELKTEEGSEKIGAIAMDFLLGGLSDTVSKAKEAMPESADILDGLLAGIMGTLMGGNAA